jgi:hypothetical protein
MMEVCQRCASATSRRSGSGRSVRPRPRECRLRPEPDPMSAAVPEIMRVPRFRVAVTGATGLVGSALVPALLAAGHRVDRLMRRPPTVGTTDVEWDPARGRLDPRALEGVDAVVHLAGESIAARRWSAAVKERIRRSRVDGTRPPQRDARQPRAPAASARLGVRRRVLRGPRRDAAHRGQRSRRRSSWRTSAASGRRRRTPRDRRASASSIRGSVWSSRSRAGPCRE